MISVQEVIHVKICKGSDTKHPIPRKFPDIPNIISTYHDGQNQFSRI